MGAYRFISILAVTALVLVIGLGHDRSPLAAGEAGIGDQDREVITEALMSGAGILGRDGADVEIRECRLTWLYTKPESLCELRNFRLVDAYSVNMRDALLPEVFNKNPVHEGYSFAAIMSRKAPSPGNRVVKGNIEDSTAASISRSIEKIGDETVEYFRLCDGRREALRWGYVSFSVRTEFVDSLYASLSRMISLCAS